MCTTIAKQKKRDSRIVNVDGKVGMTGRDRGFTIIELLVVMAIIGLLAAIAIPVFSKLKNNAYDSAAQADLRGAALQVESAFTSTGTYPAATPGSAAVVGPPAIPAGPSTLPASMIGATGSVKITNPTYTQLNYKVATNGQGFVLSASDSRTPNLYCYVSTLGGQQTLTGAAATPANCFALLTT